MYGTPFTLNDKLVSYESLVFVKEYLEYSKKQNTALFAHVKDVLEEITLNDSNNLSRFLGQSLPDSPRKGRLKSYNNDILNILKELEKRKDSYLLSNNKEVSFEDLRGC